MEVSLRMHRHVSGGRNDALGDGDGLAVVVDELPGNFNWKAIDGTSWLTEDQQAGMGFISAVHSVGGFEVTGPQIVALAKTSAGDEVCGDGFQRIPGGRRNGRDCAIASGVRCSDQLEIAARVPDRGCLHDDRAIVSSGVEEGIGTHWQDFDTIDSSGRRPGQVLV